MLHKRKLYNGQIFYQNFEVLEHEQMSEYFNFQVFTAWCIVHDAKHSIAALMLSICQVSCCL